MNCIVTASNRRFMIFGDNIEGFVILALYDNASGQLIGENAEDSQDDSFDNNKSKFFVMFTLPSSCPPPKTTGKRSSESFCLKSSRHLFSQKKGF